VNIPVGIAAVLLCRVLIPPDAETRRGSLDVAGAITITASLMLAVYAIVNGQQKGWTSGQTTGLLAAALVLLAVFLAIESRVEAPLMPLGLFRFRNVSTANVVGILLAGAMFGWFFLSALYLQQVLGYSPLQVGFAFLPGTLLWGASSYWLSGQLVMRFGIKKPIVAGLSLFVIGLLLFARAPVDGSFAMDVLPSMLFMGLGGGITFNPILLAAMGDVAPTEAGLASGIVNTSFMMGGALGLAVLASLAASRTDSLRSSGHDTLSALTGGYHAAFVAGAAFAVVAILGALLIHTTPAMAAHAAQPEAEAESAAA